MEVPSWTDLLMIDADSSGWAWLLAGWWSGLAVGCRRPDVGRHGCIDDSDLMRICDDSHALGRERKEVSRGVHDMFFGCLWGAFVGGLTRICTLGAGLRQVARRSGGRWRCVYILAHAPTAAQHAPRGTAVEQRVGAWAGRQEFPARSADSGARTPHGPCIYYRGINESDVWLFGM